MAKTIDFDGENQTSSPVHMGRQAAGLQLMAHHTRQKSNQWDRLFMLIGCSHRPFSALLNIPT